MSNIPVMVKNADELVSGGRFIRVAVNPYGDYWISEITVNGPIWQKIYPNSGLIVDMVTVNDNNYDYHVRDLIGYPHTGSCLVKYSPEVWALLSSCKDAFDLIEKSQNRKLTDDEKENFEFGWDQSNAFNF